MKKILYLFLFIYAFTACDKENCNYETNSLYTINTFKDSFAFIYFSGNLSIPSVTCEHEIIKNPIGGVAEIIDSIGIKYTPNSNFEGIDELTYKSSNCNEIDVLLHVWASPSNYCNDEIANLRPCREVNHIILPGVSSTTTGYRVINQTCLEFIESVEILVKPVLGDVDFDGEYLNYTFKKVEGEDKVKIKVCLLLENNIVCNESTWFFSIKRK